MNQLTDSIHRDRRRKLGPAELASIREAVVSAEETQQQIADRHGCSRSYVSRVGKDAHAMYDLLERLGTTESELLMEADPGEAWELIHRLSTLLEVDRMLRRRGLHLTTGARA